LTASPQDPAVRAWHPGPIPLQTHTQAHTGPVAPLVSAPLPHACDEAKKQQRRKKPKEIFQNTLLEACGSPAGEASGMPTTRGLEEGAQRHRGKRRGPGGLLTLALFSLVVAPACLCLPVDRLHRAPSAALQGRACRKSGSAPESQLLSQLAPKPLRLKGGGLCPSAPLLPIHRRIRSGLFSLRAHAGCSCSPMMTARTCAQRANVS
jgi:hypothetical protein